MTFGGYSQLWTHISYNNDNDNEQRRVVEDTNNTTNKLMRYVISNNEEPEVGRELVIPAFTERQGLFVPCPSTV